MQIQINIIYLFFAAFLFAVLLWEIYAKMKAIRFLTAELSELKYLRSEYQREIQLLCNDLTKDTVDKILNLHRDDNKIPPIDQTILDTFVDRAILHINEWPLIKNRGRYERRLIWGKGEVAGIMIMFVTTKGDTFFIARYKTNGE